MGSIRRCIPYRAGQRMDHLCEADRFDRQYLLYKLRGNCAGRSSACHFRYRKRKDILCCTNGDGQRQIRCYRNGKRKRSPAYGRQIHLIPCGGNTGCCGNRQGRQPGGNERDCKRRAYRCRSKRPYLRRLRGNAFPAQRRRGYLHKQCHL